MIQLLRDEGFTPPLSSQITTFLSSLRQQTNSDATGSANMQWSLADIEKFASTRQQVPVSKDQLFVAAISTKTEPAKRFSIFVTTKRLLEFASYVS
jgi:hypothetical protein